MEFYAYPSHSLPSSSSIPFSFGNFVDRVKEYCRFAVSAIIGNLFSAIFTFFFAIGEYLQILFFFLLVLVGFLFHGSKFLPFFFYITYFWFCCMVWFGFWWIWSGLLWVYLTVWSLNLTTFFGLSYLFWEIRGDSLSYWLSILQCSFYKMQGKRWNL